MKQYTIAFNSRMYYAEVYEAIISGMSFPDWCGKNKDAIWDMLTFDTELPAVVYIEGANTAVGELKTLLDEIIEIFFEAKKWHNNNGNLLEIKIL